MVTPSETEHATVYRQTTGHTGPHGATQGHISHEEEAAKDHIQLGDTWGHVCHGF